MTDKTKPISASNPPESKEKNTNQKQEEKPVNKKKTIK